MAINFPNDPATNPGNGGQWTDPGGSGVWQVELINGEAIWTLVSTPENPGGGAASLNELNDVTLSSPEDNQILAYNQSTGQWVNVPRTQAADIDLNDLNDVDTTGGSSGDVLANDNGTWKPLTLPSQQGVEEAPADGTPYVRQDAGWVAASTVDEPPADGGSTQDAYLRKPPGGTRADVDTAYARSSSGEWVPGVRGDIEVIGDVDIDVQGSQEGYVLKFNGTKYTSQPEESGGGGGGGIPEAPNDGKQYGRQSEGWTEIVGGSGGGSGPSTTDDLPEGSTNLYFPEAPNDGKQYVRRSLGWMEAEVGVASVNDQTGVVSLGITDLNDYAAPPVTGGDPNSIVYSYTEKGSDGSNPSTGEWTRFNDSSIMWSPTDSGGKNVDDDPIFGMNGNYQVWLSFDDGPWGQHEINVNRFSVYLSNSELAEYGYDVAGAQILRLSFGTNEPPAPGGGELEEGSVLTWNGSAFQALAPAGGGGDTGGSGVEEAPVDGNPYVRQDGAWESLNYSPTLAHGSRTTDSVDLAAAEEIGYTSATNAEAQGWTVVINQLTSSDDYDDGVIAVEMPAWSAGKSWLNISDPNLAGAAEGTPSKIYVSGNGFACFIAQSDVDAFAYPNYESGYGQYAGTANIPLLFGFTNVDCVIDLALTKEVTYDSKNWFVIRLQWADDYDSFGTNPGDQAGAGNFPSTAYDPINEGGPDFSGGGAYYGKKPREKTRTRTPRAAQDTVYTAELWLGEDGGVRMLYGRPQVAVSVAELGVAEGYTQQTNGVYKAGVPIAEMGGKLNFHDFDTNGLNYNQDHTNDGNDNQPIMDWYWEYQPAEKQNPYPGEAPMDGKQYARQNASWTEVAASSGGGGGASNRDVDGMLLPVVQPQARQMFYGMELQYPYNQYSNGGQWTTPDPDFAIVGSATKPYRDYVWGDTRSGQPNFGDDPSATFFFWRNTIDGKQYLALNTYDAAGNFIDLYGEAASFFTEQWQRTGSYTKPPLTDQYGQTQGTVFVFCTFSFWHCYETDPNVDRMSSSKWQRMEVDTWIPIWSAASTEDLTNDYLGFTIDQDWYDNTDPANPRTISDVEDFIGATMAELDGSQFADGIPGVVQDFVTFSGYDLRTTLRVFLGEENPGTNTDAGGGGGEARNGGFLQMQDKAPVYGGIETLTPNNGYVMVFRPEPETTQNAGNVYADGDSGAPVKSAEEKEADRAAKKEERRKLNEAALSEKAEGKGAGPSDLPLKNPGGFGWTPPGFNPNLDDPRYMQDYTLNLAVDRDRGALQLDVLGLHDLWGFDPYLKVHTPVANDTLEWDDLNKQWTLASQNFSSRSASREKKVLEILEAFKEDPELKAAFKAALAD